MNQGEYPITEFYLAPWWATVAVYFVVYSLYLWWAIDVVRGVEVRGDRRLLNKDESYA